MAKKYYKWWLLCIGAGFAASIVHAAPRAAILDYGYYEFSSDSERIANPLSTSGYVTRGEAKLVEQTRRIPIEKGRLFGFRFRIDNMNESVGLIPLVLVVKHPEIEKPDGSKSTGYRYQMDLKVAKGAVEDRTGYRLNEPYELVEGEWSFEYRFMNKTLLKQTFTTYQP